MAIAACLAGTFCSNVGISLLVAIVAALVSSCLALAAYDPWYYDVDTESLVPRTVKIVATVVFFVVFIIVDASLTSRSCSSTDAAAKQNAAKYEMLLQQEQTAEQMAEFGSKHKAELSLMHELSKQLVAMPEASRTSFFNALHGLAFSIWKNSPTTFSFSLTKEQMSSFSKLAKHFKTFTCIEDNGMTKIVLEGVESLHDGMPAVKHVWTFAPSN